MNVVAKAAGSLLVFLGTIWCLQGLNVLPGSFMTGQIRWAEYGGIAVGVGIALLFAGKAGRSTSLREFTAIEYRGRPRDQKTLIVKSSVRPA